MHVAAKCMTPSEDDPSPYSDIMDIDNIFNICSHNIEVSNFILHFLNRFSVRQDVIACKQTHQFAKLSQQCMEHQNILLVISNFIPI